MTSTELQAVAGLLIGGFVIFLVGAALWRMDYQSELPEALQAIAKSPGRWRWIHAWMIAGVAVTIIGLAALALVMAASDEPVYGAAGGALFAVGGIVWLVGASWRITWLLRAAVETAETGSIPAGADAWTEWFGALHTTHLLSAYLSWTLIGSAVIASDLAPLWVGWLGIGLGVVGAVGYIVLKGGPFAPPILAHLYTLILGIMLLITA